MATYIISYDLRAPGRNYDDLYEAIKSLGAWWHNVVGHVFASMGNVSKLEFFKYIIVNRRGLRV